MLVFQEGGKTGNLEKNPQNIGKQPTTNLTHILYGTTYIHTYFILYTYFINSTELESNPAYINGRGEPSHHCTNSAPNKFRLSKMENLEICLRYHVCFHYQQLTLSDGHEYFEKCHSELCCMFGVSVKSSFFHY